MSPPQPPVRLAALALALAAIASGALVHCTLRIEEQGRKCVSSSDCEDGWTCVLANRIPHLCTKHGNCCVRKGDHGTSCRTSDDCIKPNVCVAEIAQCVNPEIVVTDGGVAQELSCLDGRDNDLDGKTDCRDLEDCEGQRCDDKGNACFSGQCRCEDGQIETCDDGLDNDCDGMIDCEDIANCNGQTCRLNAVCQGNVCKCLLGDPPEQLCSDQTDNDCDGRIDCADPDCNNKPCDNSQATFRCNASRRCEQGTGEQSCGDMIDQDLDGMTDCADPDCETVDCSSMGRVGMRCERDFADPNMRVRCTCPGGGGMTERSCGDGRDNDCDGMTDCEDVIDCPEGEVCVPNVADPLSNLICTAGACQCSGATLIEQNCRDDRDNDCNFRVDCGDPNCHMKDCADGFVCNLETGNCDLPAQ